ncbi:MAG: hypothetical protein ABIR15_17060 [Chitinophagaceae bacterium]
MSNDFSDRKAKNYILRRSILDYGWGILIAGVGLFYAFADRFGFEVDIRPFFRYSLAVLFVIYGAFRIYRGYKKNYFSE